MQSSSGFLLFQLSLCLTFGGKFAEPFNLLATEVFLFIVARFLNHMLLWWNVNAGSATDSTGYQPAASVSELSQDSFPRVFSELDLRARQIPELETPDKEFKADISRPTLCGTPSAAEVKLSVWFQYVCGSGHVHRERTVVWKNGPDSLKGDMPPLSTSAHVVAERAPNETAGRSHPAILTLKEVAQVLRCSKAHAANLIKGTVKGVPRLEHLSVGRRKLIRREWLDRWMEANKTRC